MVLDLMRTPQLELERDPAHNLRSTTQLVLAKVVIIDNYRVYLLGAVVISEPAVELRPLMHTVEVPWLPQFASSLLRML